MHRDARSGESRQSVGRRMPEAVARPDADQRHCGLPECECRGHVAVDASVMRDLDHLDATAPRLEDSELGLLLRVPEQQRAMTVLLEQQNDARVVGAQTYVPPAGPQYAHLHATDRKLHPPSQPHNRVRVRLGSRGEGRHSVILNVGNADPAGARHARQPVETSRVVVVRMGEHDTIELAHPRPCQCLPQHHRVGPRVHEDGSSAVPDQDGVSLPHVEDLYAAGDRRRERRSADERDHRDADAQAYPESPARDRPPQPQQGSARDPRPGEPPRRRRHRQQRTRHPRRDLPDPRRELCRDNTGARQPRSDLPAERSDDRPRGAEPDRDLDRHSADRQGDGTQQGHRAEHPRGKRGHRQLRRRGTTQGPGRPPSDHRREPRARQNREQRDPAHRCRPQQESCVVCGRGIGDHEDGQSRAERGCRIPPASDQPGKDRRSCSDRGAEKG